MPRATRGGKEKLICMFAIDSAQDGTDSVFAAAPKNQMALYRARFQGRHAQD